MPWATPCEAAKSTYRDKGDERDKGMKPEDFRVLPSFTPKSFMILRLSPASLHPRLTSYGLRVGRSDETSSGGGGANSCRDKRGEK